MEKCNFSKTLPELFTPLNETSFSPCQEFYWTPIQSDSTPSRRGSAALHIDTDYKRSWGEKAGGMQN